MDGYINEKESQNDLGIRRALEVTYSNISLNNPEGWPSAPEQDGLGIKRPSLNLSLNALVRDHGQVT